MRMIGLFALIVFSKLIFAEDTISLVGVGARSCGQYLEARASRDGVYEIATLHWVQGFLSGMNTYRALAPRNSTKLTLPAYQSISAFIDKYCRENPLKAVSDGAYDLYLTI